SSRNSCSDVRGRSVDCRLQTADCRFTDCRLPIADLRIEDWRLGLGIGDWNADCRLATNTTDSTSYLLPPVSCLLSPVSWLLACFDHQDRHGDVVPQPVGGRASQKIVEEAMPVRGHRDEIDVLRGGDARELGRRIAHRQVRPRLEPARDELLLELIEI